MKPRMKKLIWIVPAAILGMAVFCLIGGAVVMLLWNWLTPLVFGMRQINFWQALGLLALCRILFGGFGLNGGGSRRNSRGRMGQWMRERWGQMTPEDRERFRQSVGGDWRGTTPLDSNPNA